MAIESENRKQPGRPGSAGPGGDYRVKRLPGEKPRDLVADYEATVSEENARITAEQGRVRRILESKK